MLAGHFDAVRSQHHTLSWIAGQVALVTAGIGVYFGVRGLTEGSPAVALANSHQVLALEEKLGLDVEEQGQRLVMDWAEPLIAPANWVYVYGHWPVIIVTMVWLALQHRNVYRQLRDAMMISGMVGLVIFALYPVSPPRLAGLDLVDTITENSRAYRVLQPPAFVNQYAAMPSLHAGWDLLVGLAIAAASTHAWLRWAGRTLPLLMAVAVVLTGNHYVLDVVAGLALALLGLLAASALDRRRRLRAVHALIDDHDPAAGRTGQNTAGFAR